jgi:hypothetical protein
MLDLNVRTFDLKKCLLKKRVDSWGLKKFVGRLSVENNKFEMQVCSD